MAKDQKISKDLAAKQEANYRGIALARLTELKHYHERMKKALEKVVSVHNELARFIQEQ